MVNQYARNNAHWRVIIVSACLLMLSACSSTPHVQTASPPATVANDTREIGRDTAEPASNQVLEPYSDTVKQLPPDAPRSLGEEVALRAIALVGTPYRYGGADLTGFDCSGLVLYVYHELGIDLPHSAVEQHRFTTKISRDELLPGDLIFFRINRKRISHVGIYIGDNRFVHAPQLGKSVVIRNLDDEYYHRHWVGAGRVM